MHFKKQFFVLLVCSIIFSVNTYSQKGERGIAAVLDSLVNLPFFDSAIISLDINNLTSHQSVFAKNNKFPLRSASNMKILTSAAALHYLGSELQITTKILTDGTVKRGILNGNLYIKGGGDPLFELSDLDSLVTQLKEAGIHTVNGRIIPDVSLFDTVRWAKGWMWDDDPYADAPYITPLSINRNAVSIEVRYDNDAKLFDVSVNPESRFFKIVNQILVSSSEQTNLSYVHERAGGKEKIFIKGVWNQADTLTSESMSILRPEEFFEFAFTEKCKDAGIHIRNKSKKKNSVSLVCLAQRWHSVSEIVSVMNKSSNNLCAELLSRNLCAAGIVSGITGEDGLRYTDSLINLTGFNPKNYRIDDGSGASHYNIVTSELINGVLKYFYYNEPRNFPILKNSFPQAGVDGTLRNRITNGKAYKRIFAKTGTISGVSALSGYASGLSGNEYSFSILMQINPKDINRARRIQEAICEVLASN
jgi:serine-type D-Ala-D-Ala carboxypeptidase/endopeptidase (penicillin-binding protein 4)